MSKRIRFALMGCGSIACKHADAIANHLENADLVAICDPDLERAELCANQYGVQAFANLQEMMKTCGTNIDVICVLTPTGMHPAHVHDVAALGKHAVVEKPMALSSCDAEAMLSSCRNAGVSLFVVKQNRYNRPIQRLNKALEEKRFGNLVMVTARVRWRRDDAYYERDEWRGSVTMDGGVMANQASHHIDLMQWIGGEVTSVYCIKSCRLAHIESDDTAIATLNFKSGAIGVIEATTAARPKDLEGSISVLGEGGTVEIGGFAANQITTWQFVEPTTGDAETWKDHFSNPADNPVYAHASYLQDVVDQLLGHKTPTITGEEGAKTVAIIEAMQRSSQTNKPVQING